MATLNIGGKRVKVDDSFLKLSPEDQQKTVDEIAQSMGSGPQSEGMGKAFASGAMRGTASLAGAAMKAVPAGNLIAAALGKKNPYSTENLTSGISAVTGGYSDYQPVGTKEEYARTVGEFAPGAALGAVTGGGSLLAQGGNFLKFGVAPALTSETAGQLTKDTPVEPYARAAAAIATPFAIQGARRLITPNPISAERARNAEILRKEGVKSITAGQKVDSKALKGAEATLGGGKASRIQDAQAEEFTHAVLRRAGINARRATPEVMDDAYKTIGAKFDKVAEGHIINPDKPLINDIQKIVYNAKQDITQLPPRVETMAKRIVEDLQKGITPERYRRLSHELGKFAYGARKDPQLSDVYYALRDSLDDALTRTIQKSGDIKRLGEMKVLRKDYSNLKTITKVMAKSGDTTEGLISPAALRQTVSSGAGQTNYVRGKGDFTDLARAGANIMKPLPDSGTSGRLMATMGGAGAVRSGAGAALGNVIPGVGPAVGAAAGYALPPIMGRAMLSGPGRAYLGNQLMGPGSTPLPLLFPPIASSGLLNNR